MNKFQTLTAIAAPFPQKNVDTDFIIRIERCTGTPKDEIGQYAFETARYLPDGADDPAFVLNQPRYRGATVLLARENFGCGSSREHAPWALLQYGFQTVIAPSFADIFYNNSLKNGLLLIKLDASIVDRLFKEAQGAEGYRLAVDLEAQTVATPGGESFKFDIDPFAKNCLLNGLDEIGLTLKHAASIKAFEAKHRERQPWLFS